MNMMGFHHRNIIVGEIIHNLGQVFVDSRENGYSQTEVGGPEQCLSFFLTQTAHFVTVFSHPSCTSGNHLYTILESFQAIAVSYRRCRKLNGNICRAKSFGRKILTIIDIDDAHNLMSAGKSNFLNLFTHLSISNQCYFHNSLIIFNAKIVFFSINHYIYPTFTAR